MKLIARILLAGALLVSKGVFSEGLPQTPLNYGFSVDFESKLLQEKIPLNIYLPDSFNQVSDDFRYPVIFINGSHGRRFFHTLTGVVRHLASVNRMPESIVVSLNYSGHFPETYTNGMWSKREVISGYGNPPMYVKALKQELFPYLEQQYRALNSRMIIGISGSALFPLYTASQHPELFNHYALLAASDMLGMSFDAATKAPLTESLPKLIATQHQGLMYIGNADDDLENKPNYLNNLATMQKNYSAVTNKNKGLLAIETYENERHYDAFIKLLLSFFEHLYPEQHWAPKYRDLVAKEGDAMDNIDAYYQQLSQAVGYQVLPKPQRWNSVNSLQFIVNHLVTLEREQEALKVAQRLVQYLPTQIHGYMALSQVHQALKDDQQTLDNLLIAQEMAKKNGDWQLEDITQKINQLTESD